LNSNQSKFHIGQNIRVVAGVKDPDYGFLIEGWSGDIEDIELTDDGSWLYHIQWDKKTLKLMGRVLRKQCEGDNLDFARMVLAENELEIG